MPSIHAAVLASILGGPSPEDLARIATARQLAIDGVNAVEAADCRRGMPLLEKAEELFHAVVHLQYMARCLAAEGHLVAATELWRRVDREPIPADGTQVVHAAHDEARREL